MKKISTAIIFIFLLQGCGENSDGSDKSTYSSCSITSSEAVWAEDRAEDISQCWDGVDIEEKSLALDWCRKKVTHYMSKYVFGHNVSLEVKSTNCPQ